MENIVYLHAGKNKVRLVLNETVLTIKSSLKETVGKLPLEIFCQVHPSYVVNVAYIQHFNRECILLSNQTEIPISERFRQRLLKQICIIARA